MSALLKLALAASLLHVARAGVCSTLADSSIEVAQPLTVAWSAEQLEYWSTGCSLLKPSCILFPKSAQEVATIIEALHETNETFAVKSGGHNPNLGWASIDGGPLISLARLNHVDLDTASETAAIGPGNRWDEVADKLDGTGYTAVGGRLGNVGVGGYMMGGGLSFMSAEYGWAADSVQSFELVLANATVITVTRDNHPELFKSLRGGGNNFGIVTSFNVSVYPQGQVWGGNYFFNATPATDEALLDAVSNFTRNCPDRKAGIILTAERAAAGVIDGWIMFLYYNGPTPPAGVFDGFKAVKPWLDTTKTRSFADLVKTNNWAVIKSVYLMGTETIPMPRGRGADAIALSTLKDVHRNWRAVSGTVLLPVPGLVASMAYQPIPRVMSAVAQAKGGDLLDLDTDVDLIIPEFNYSFLVEEKASRALVDQAMQDSYNGVRNRVIAGQADGKLPANAYLPLFANDLHYRQDYFGRLRPENRDMAKRARDDADPTGFFRDRTAGMRM